MLCTAVPLMTPAAVVVAATPSVDAPPVSLIGDSTMAGMAWNSTAGNDPRDIVANSYRLTFDAESCRRLVQASCRGRFGTMPLSVLALIKSTLAGRLGEGVGGVGGYDDASLNTPGDQGVAGARGAGGSHGFLVAYPP